MIDDPARSNRQARYLPIKRGLSVFDGGSKTTRAIISLWFWWAERRASAGTNPDIPAFVQNDGSGGAEGGG
jgi:hypothetical protein